MKTFLGAALLLALTGPQMAFAASCNMDDLGVRAYMTANEANKITGDLTKKGYMLDAAAQKDFTLLVSEPHVSESGLTCSRTVSVYGPRIEGNLPIKPLFHVLTSSLGATIQESCAMTLRTAVKIMPTCKVMMKRAQKAQSR